jgi:hypothetical protein
VIPSTRRYGRVPAKGRPLWGTGLEVLEQSLDHVSHLDDSLVKSSLVHPGGFLIARNLAHKLEGGVFDLFPRSGRVGIE